MGIKAKKVKKIKIKIYIYYKSLSTYEDGRSIVNKKRIEIDYYKLITNFH